MLPQNDKKRMGQNDRKRRARNDRIFHNSGDTILNSASFSALEPPTAISEFTVHSFGVHGSQFREQPLPFVPLPLDGGLQ